MKKLSFLVIMLIIVVFSTGHADQIGRSKKDPDVKSFIWAETSLGIRFNQTRNIPIPYLNQSVPIWWDVIIVDKKNAHVDFGWNPTVWSVKNKEGKEIKKASLWLLLGNKFRIPDLRVISWTYDLFAIQKLNNWFFDQEWIYFQDIHKNWFRSYVYYEWLGIQITGTIQHGLLKATVGPRIKIPHGSQKLELYFGLWGVEKDYQKLQPKDWNHNNRTFWARYSIYLK